MAGSTRSQEDLGKVPSMDVKKDIGGLGRGLQLCGTESEGESILTPKSHTDSEAKNAWKGL